MKGRSFWVPWRALARVSEVVATSRWSSLSDHTRTGK
ncbi:hypothetical protein A2U01_0054039, partial [Trifolium medium]|nr:hypothetical protein [Trifolium medium]